MNDYGPTKEALHHTGTFKWSRENASVNDYGPTEETLPAYVLAEFDGFWAVPKNGKAASDPSLWREFDFTAGFHQARLAKTGSFQRWEQSKLGQELGLLQQFAMQREGDVSQRLNLSQKLMDLGGWRQHRHHGLIATSFMSSAFSDWYAGGGCYPAHAWYPTRSSWVAWSCWDACPSWFDPRAPLCLPCVYAPCSPWVYFKEPVWKTLPVVSCGTWINVAPVKVAGLDLQLLACRLVDSGLSQYDLGPRYRICLRNNSLAQIETPFSVLLLASNELAPTDNLPQSGVVIPSMKPGETQAVDIRLPLAANRLGTTPEGYRVPFTYLHVLVDAHQQIAEAFEDNNGAVLTREEIFPVDPAAFSTDLTAAAPNRVLTVAGEGFGPEPGDVIVSVYGHQVQAEILGWYDLGIRFAVPNFELTRSVNAEVLFLRGDGQASNPLIVQLAPQEMLEAAADLPDSPIPDPAK